MPGNRVLFRRARDKRARLLNDGRFSLPSGQGSTAIVCSSFTDEPPDTETGMTELALFEEEAAELARRVRSSGGGVVVALKAERKDISGLLRDTTVSDVFVIGNGSLSTLLLGERDYYDWVNVADAMTHLKLGRFVQRQCGGLTRVLNVPLGLFAVADQRLVHAALDPAFYPKSLDDPVNDKVQPVFAHNDVDYDCIKRLGSIV